ncbi:sensor histidine kinase [Schaalia cardiffensis F0333]|uniref:Sensor histidine kinase n=1 Tax=Schaalia cardiffensis F0333 TaxID=888050 RepID=N6XD73_9ACTO|nr:sensor histidine kinase [Schaalia cardiffensis F0333]
MLASPCQENRLLIWATVLLELWKANWAQRCFTAREVLHCPGSAPLPEKVVSSFLPDAGPCSAQGNSWGMRIWAK